MASYQRSPFMTRSSALLAREQQLSVEVNAFFAGVCVVEDLHTKAGDSAAEVEVVLAYPEWCQKQAQDDGHQHETLSADIASTKADDAAKAESTGSDVSPLANEIVSPDREVTHRKP